MSHAQGHNNENPLECPECQEWIEALAKQCFCRGIDKPCDGLLSGGFCDNYDGGQD